MDTRRKEKNRVLFSVEKKQKILHKSKGVCAHCGKELCIENMTVEHVIPLSKGGDNELSNLVALCKECNESKSNYIIAPQEYYKYLDDIYLNRLCKNFSNYCDNVEWISKKNLLSSERFYMGMDIIEGKGCIGAVYHGVEISKAVYSDLDGIYEAYLKYFRKNKVSVTDDIKNDLKNFISMVFLEGSLFFSKNSAGDVTIVIPCYLKKYAGLVQLFIGKILMTYDKVRYVSALSEFLMRFVSQLCWDKDNIHIVGFILAFFTFGKNSNRLIYCILDIMQPYLIKEKEGMFTGNYSAFFAGCCFSVPTKYRKSESMDSLEKMIRDKLEVNDNSFSKFCADTLHISEMTEYEAYGLIERVI